MLHNIDDFGVLFPGIVNYASKLIDNTVQAGNIQQVGHIEVSDRSDNLFDKRYFFLTIFDNWAFGGINTFFNNGDGNGKGSMVWYQSPIWMNRVVVKFAWPTTKEYEVNDRVWIIDIIRISSQNRVSSEWKF